MLSLGSSPSLKIRGLRSDLSLKKWDFGTKNNKEKYIFEKGEGFGAAQAEKVGSLRVAEAKKWGLLGGTYCTVLIW